MARFNLQDLHSLEAAPTSPGGLRSKVGELIVGSTTCRAKVEAVNPETGEYRVVLQGTLDQAAYSARFGSDQP
jgi:hypothetical protein